MHTIINADLTALVLDSEDSPQFMLRLPNYDLTTMRPFVSEDEARAQAAKYHDTSQFLPYASDEELQAVAYDMEADIVRRKRNFLLSETDWAVLPDSPANGVYQEYRQALRDITAQGGFPFDIVWPIKPGSTQPSTGSGPDGGPVVES